MLYIIGEISTNSIYRKIILSDAEHCSTIKAEGYLGSCSELTEIIDAYYQIMSDYQCSLTAPLGGVGRWRIAERKLLLIDICFK